MSVRNLPTAYQLETSILRDIHRSFEVEHWDYITNRLATTGLPMGAIAPPPRVHAAILWLAKGEVAAFDTALAEACSDWRRTLAAAGLANQNWKKVLEKRRIDCLHWALVTSGKPRSG